MINDFIKKLFKPSGLDNLVPTPKNLNASFILAYDNKHIGTLELKEGMWNFSYSVFFKNQNKIKPLMDFPNKEKEYKSKELLPFFASRIPGINQPRIQEKMKEINMAEPNEASLLKHFGRKTITNPFVLESQF